MKKHKNLNTKNTDIENISGEYQYEALNNANPAQRQWHKNRLNLINYLNFFNINDEFLDAGCGSGNTILKFAPKVKKALGIDNNKKCVVFLKQKIKEEKIKNADVLEMDLLDIKLKNKFSKIVLCEVVEHFNESDVNLLLVGLEKFLLPGGKILITTPNYQSAWSIIEEVIDHLKLSPTLWGEQHLIKFTPKKLNELVKNAGLKVEKQGTLNTISPFISIFNKDLADKISYKEFSLPVLGNLIYLVAVKK